MLIFVDRGSCFPIFLSLLWTANVWEILSILRNNMWITDGYGLILSMVVMLYIFLLFFFLQRPEKYLGDIETWNKAEQQLTEALNEFGKPWQVLWQSLPSECLFQSMLLEVHFQHSLFSQYG